MAKYKLIFDGKELEKLFDTYEEAEEEASLRCCDAQIEAQVLYASNPRDYFYAEEDWFDPEYEIIEV